ncbi:hypothetical protein D9619_003044 [Psilocybe cf. subviscida]|uniref:Mitochondrial import inner membrane translocase subunit n=1 Tax=Psilocybe cf. subviscida TaxID=2480587 RepID=A0A8H5AXB9_9AGAR|nr:hypothetical protein D9619_003044 [Psilocybe cf. subviscida]
MLEKESVEGVATMGRVVGTPSPFIAAQVRRLYVSRLSYFHGSSRQRILLDTVMDKFDEATQKELSTFLNQEQARAKMNSSIHELTGVCWTKCVTGTPGRSFSRTESNCLANCVDRFFDASLYMVKEVQDKVF